MLPLVADMTLAEPTIPESSILKVVKRGELTTQESRSIEMGCQDEG